MESMKKDLVFDLREEGCVSIPAEEYKRLAACEDRLSILQKMRVNNIMTKSYASLETQDFVLGDPVLEAWDAKKKGGILLDE
jgi:hypothetical protein